MEGFVRSWYVNGICEEGELDSCKGRVGADTGRGWSIQQNRERQLYVYHKARAPFPHQLPFTLRTNPQPLLGAPKAE